MNGEGSRVRTVTEEKRKVRGKRGRERKLFNQTKMNFIELLSKCIT